MNAIKHFSKPENMHKTAGNSTDTIISFMMNEILMKALPQKKWNTLVDIGSAFGTGASSINKALKFNEVICVDGSAPLLQMLNEKKNSMFGSTPVKTFCVNMETGQIPVGRNAAQMVSCYAMSMYLPSLDPLFSEASRLLEPDGIFFFDSHTKHGDRYTETYPSGLIAYLHSHESIPVLAERHSFSIEGYSISIPNPEIGKGAIESYFFLKKK